MREYDTAGGKREGPGSRARSLRIGRGASELEICAEIESWIEINELEHGKGVGF
jgi:hypothetical protein